MRKAWQYISTLEVLGTYLLPLNFKQYSQNPKQVLRTDFFYSVLIFFILKVWEVIILLLWTRTLGGHGGGRGGIWYIYLHLLPCQRNPKYFTSRVAYDEVVKGTGVCLNRDLNRIKTGKRSWGKVVLVFCKDKTTLQQCNSGGLILAEHLPTGVQNPNQPYLHTLYLSACSPVLQFVKISRTHQRLISITFRNKC